MSSSALRGRSMETEPPGRATSAVEMSKRRPSASSSAERSEGKVGGEVGIVAEGEGVETMNILLLIDDLLPGGIARHIVDIANSFPSDEYKVFVAATPSSYVEKLHPNSNLIPLSLLKNNSFKKNI